MTSIRTHRTAPRDGARPTNFPAIPCLSDNPTPVCCQASGSGTGGN